jgi:PhzF family phenazine biosynthesis protein
VELTLFQIDAFSDELFKGNPAAVCPLQAWLPNELMQKIAAENNLSETAFFVPTEIGFHIRWFTPVTEVNLCGHATLATAFVLFKFLAYPKDIIEFQSLSGNLYATRKGDLIEMDFPSQEPKPCKAAQALLEAFAIKSAICLKAEDYILVFNSEAEVRMAKPNTDKLLSLDLRGVAMTAPGESCDFVSRFFAPKFGISEDPVTGSLHTQIGPYWSKRLGKKEMTASQVSARSGKLLISVDSKRVHISGQARLYLQGKIYIT